MMVCSAIGHSSCVLTWPDRALVVKVGVARGHGLGRGICKTQNPFLRGRITLDVKCSMLKKKVYSF